MPLLRWSSVQSACARYAVGKSDVARVARGHRCESHALKLSRNQTFRACVRTGSRVGAISASELFGGVSRGIGGSRACQAIGPGLSGHAEPTGSGRRAAQSSASGFAHILAKCQGWSTQRERAEDDGVNGGAARVRVGGGRRRRPRPGRGGAGAGERLVHTRRSHFQPLAIAQAIFPPSSPNPDSINWRRRRFSYQGLYSYGSTSLHISHTLWGLCYRSRSGVQVVLTHGTGPVLAL